MQLACGVLEGGTTGAMLVGTVLAGETRPFLLLTYLVHWAVSATYHVKPTPATLETDLTWIEVLMFERTMAMYGSLTTLPLAAVYWLSARPLMAIRIRQSFIQLYSCGGYLVHMACHRHLGLAPAFAMGVLSAILFSLPVQPTVCRCLFHLAIGVGAHLESLHYKPCDGTQYAAVVRAIMYTNL